MTHMASTVIDIHTSTSTSNNTQRSLDQQRAEFSHRRFLAMPLAGTIAWLIIGVAGLLLTPFQAAMTLYVATGSIVYLGIFLSRFTGENFLDKSKPKNAFDKLFLHGVVQALLVFAIAIPFARVDHSSLPLTVGILTGLMWIPMSWIIQHWIGLFHGIARTAAVVLVWWLFPELRYVVIPAVIVAIYLVTIVVFERRWQHLQRASAS